MKHLIITIYDKAVEHYGRPFVARTENDAIRMITQEVNRVADQNMLNLHPTDYTVYKVAEWNDETGEVTPLKPERIVECAALVTKH